MGPGGREVSEEAPQAVLVALLRGSAIYPNRAAEASLSSFQAPRGGGSEGSSNPPPPSWTSGDVPKFLNDEEGTCS